MYVAMMLSSSAYPELNWMPGLQLCYFTFLLQVAKYGIQLKLLSLFSVESVCYNLLLVLLVFFIFLLVMIFDYCN